MISTVSSRFRDNGPQTFWGHDIDLSRSRDVIDHVTNRLSIGYFLLSVDLYWIDSVLLFSGTEVRLNITAWAYGVQCLKRPHFFISGSRQGKLAGFVELDGRFSKIQNLWVGEPPFWRNLGLKSKFDPKFLRPKGFRGLCDDICHVTIWYPYVISYSCFVVTDLDLLGSSDVIGYVTIWYPICRFQNVLCCNWGWIASRFRVNGPGTFWGNDLKLSKSRNGIDHVNDRFRVRYFLLVVHCNQVSISSVFEINQSINKFSGWPNRLSNKPVPYHKNHARRKII